MPVVSVRLGDDDASFLKARGVRLGQRARVLLEDEVRRLRQAEAQDQLDAMSYTPTKSSTEIIRDDRDRGHGRHG